MLKDSRKLGCRWGLPITRCALTTTFKSEWATRLGGTWRVLPERGRAALIGGMGGCSYHRSASFEDRPLCGVLVRRDFHHPFAFLKGGWSR